MAIETVNGNIKDSTIKRKTKTRKAEKETRKP